MNSLAFVPLYNTGKKRDATGAFQPEAHAWSLVVGGAEIVGVDNHQQPPARRRAVLGAIREHRPERVAFFCHGWTGGVQVGFDVSSLRGLAEALASCSAPNVTLYCCLTGKGEGDGDGGFADRLRDALCAAGATYCRVDAHTTAGHTTRNPYVRRFEGSGSPVGATGGQWIVAPGSSIWGRWRRALTGDLRFRYPDLEISEIHDELVALPRGGAR